MKSNYLDSYGDLLREQRVYSRAIRLLQDCAEVFISDFAQEISDEPCPEITRVLNDIQSVKDRLLAIVADSIHLQDEVKIKIMAMPSEVSRGVLLRIYIQGMSLENAAKEMELPLDEAKRIHDAGVSAYDKINLYMEAPE